MNPEWDVALLKVPADDLTPVSWPNEEVGHGTWVVSNGSTSRSRRRVRVGIISANTREIEGKVPVVLGLSFGRESESELQVKEVSPDAGAKRAGIEIGDYLKEADGEVLDDLEELLEMLKMKSAGDTLSLLVDREGELMMFDVELSTRGDIFEEEITRNEAMSGRTSERRTSFPRALQHDIGLSERTVGGPLLDLEGRCVGMNIARFSRAESFAIPATDLRKVLDELLEKSGREN